MIYVVSNELYHHGILGMKWGVRRFQNKDGSLKPAGETRYYGHRSTKNGSSNGSPSKNGSNSTSSKSNSDATQKVKRKGLTDKQKKALKITAAVAGTALAAYGAYKVSQVVKNRNTAKAAAAVSSHETESIQDLIAKYGDAVRENQNRLAQESARNDAALKTHEALKTGASLKEAVNVGNKSYNDSASKINIKPIAAPKSESPNISIPRTEIQRTSIPRTEIQRTSIPRTEIKKTEPLKTTTQVIKKDLPGGGTSTMTITKSHSSSYEESSTLGKQTFEDLLKNNKSLFNSTLRNLGF